MLSLRLNLNHVNLEARCDYHLQGGLENRKRTQHRCVAITRETDKELPWFSMVLVPSSISSFSSMKHSLYYKLPISA